MGRTPPSQGKLLYHITHIDNIPSILQCGLLPRAELEARGIRDFVDIADPEIVFKRELYGNALSSYVLFHFYAKNPFDGAVCKKYGSENMAIIAIRRELQKTLEFSVIPSHPLDSDSPDIYTYEEGIKLIRWDILDGDNGRDYREPEIRKACMAECITKTVVHPRHFARIYVYNEAVKKYIESGKNGNTITVAVAPHMFP